MPFNIQDFSSQLNQGRLAYSSHFDVIVTRQNRTNKTDIERDMMFRIEASELPGRGAMTSDVFYYGMGYKMPFTTAMVELPLTIILSEDLREKFYFEEWMDEMLGDYRQGDTSPDMFDIGYYDDFVGNAIIRRYDATGLKNYEAHFRECFPTGIGSIQQTWNTDEFLKLNVTMNYRFYVEK